MLDPGPGAPALGVGSAFAALAADPTAAFWNPARLALLPRRFHWIGGWQPVPGGGRVRFPFAAASFKLNALTVGAWWAEQAWLEPPSTRDVFGGAAALHLGLVQLGVGVRRLTVNELARTAEGTALDVGLTTGIGGVITLGVVVQDALQTQLRSAQGVVLTQAPTFRGSAALQLGAFNVALEGALRQGGLAPSRVGVEVRLAGLLALRVGKDGARWSWGVGVGRPDRFQLDGAYLLDARGGSWVVSLILAFD